MEKCYVCGKPICPKCMELFGYVCSPLCKAKADSHGITVPVFQGQKAVVEARQWRRIVFASTCGGVALLAFLGLWIWYAWFGQIPKPVFSIRFPEPAYSGQSAIAGKDHGQLVFLHGDTLARYDLKSRKEIWSHDLLDRKKLAEEVEQELQSMQQRNVRLSDQGVNDLPRIPSREKLLKDKVNEAASKLGLHVRGARVWVSDRDKLILCDWATGKPAKEFPVPRGYGGLIQRGDELLVVDTESGKALVTRIDLATAQSTTEALTGGDAAIAAVSADQAGATSPARAGSTRPVEMAGLPTGRPGKDAGRPMDPARVAAQAQHLSFPARLALPAVLAGNLNQERALAEMDDSPRPAARGEGPAPAGSASLIPTANGFLQFTVRLLESRIVERSAMKPASGKSALDGAVTVGNTAEVANEVLNEMQRSRGGEMIREDLSRYQITLKSPGGPGGWTGEMTGPPAIYPLKSVNVIAANKQIIVLDQSNRKLWQSALNYRVEGGLASIDEESAMYGQGPCVERNGSLYVFDQGVLTAFDLASGDVRWRLPSVGIVGLFFDHDGMIYINSSTASPESIKYSRQVDISQKVSSTVLKVDSRNGKVLWTAEPGGLLTYVSGKVLLAVQFYQPPEPDEDFPSTDTGFEVPPYLRIRRINPSNGTEMWEHFQQRAPLDIAFDKNTIRLVFKKEVQVLEFMAL